MQKFKTKLIYPIFISHIGCPFQCIYCNQHFISNQNEIDWDNTLFQVKKFIYKSNAPKEIAFFGGSFTCLNQTEMSYYFDKFKDIIDDQTYFRISTRPDAINSDVLNFLKSKRVNTIELGIQSFSDIELAAIDRGYDSIVAINACGHVKIYDFNLCVQLLIGLPKANASTNAQTIHTLKIINPDFVRLYPLLVLKNTFLETMYNNGKYTPLSIEEAVNICALFYKACERQGTKVIKMGLHGDIDKDVVVAGPYHERFGELVKQHI